MPPLDFVIFLAVISVAAGLLGFLVGLGAGVVIVPVLTLRYYVDVRLAIGASIVSVIATSSGAAAADVREGMTNRRVGLFLEIAVTTGAISGAYMTTLLRARLLAVVLGYPAYASVQKRHATAVWSPSGDWLANRLGLRGTYYDEGEHRQIAYQVPGTRIGLALKSPPWPCTCP